MVLSTSENNKVSSRLMSVVQIDHKCYFQTDKGFKKYRQLMDNPNCALCIDNIQMEGICTELGHPLNNIDFCKRYLEYDKESYEKYSSIKNERLFMFTPIYLERWRHIDGFPFLEIFEIEKEKYQLFKYPLI